MNTIHIHDILDIIYNSGREFTIGSLEKEVVERYGEEISFMTCGDHSFGIEGMIDFMHERGKIELHGDRILPAGATWCDH